MPDDGGRHVPALPPGLRGAVVEIDVLAVHPEAGVQAADLVEHRASHEQERAEHRVRLDGSSGPLVEEVVVPLPAQRREKQAQRRTAYERRADGGEARRDACQLPSPEEHARARDAAARVRGDEVPEDRDRVRRGDRVRVRDENQLVARVRDADVRVRGERRADARSRGRARRPGAAADAVRDVRDEQELVDLRREHGQRLLELLRVAVRDDDRRDLHASLR